MQTKVGSFTLTYQMFVNAKPGYDIQFGMDFSLSSSTKTPLTQVIFPATSVGTNKAGQWNVDNHAAPGNAQSIIFTGADKGEITDKPREIVRPDKGIQRTKFAVYLVDIKEARVMTKGIKFSYSINPSDPVPRTILDEAVESTITDEQKAVLLARCNFLKFI